MKNGAENQRDTRTCKNAEYYSPRSRETPMRPSQITNRLTAKPRRMLPVGSPECPPYRAGSPCRSSCPLPTQVNSSRSHNQEHNHLAKRHSRDRPATLHRPQPKGSIHDGSQHRSSSVSHTKSPYRQKDSGIHFPSSEIRKNHKSMVVSNPGRTTMELVLQSNKDQRMQTLSSEKSIPVCSSQKRRRECDDYDCSVKKLCPPLVQTVHVEPPNSVFSSPPKISNISLPGLRNSSVLQPKIPDEPTSGQSICLGSSSTSKQLSCSSQLSKPIVTRQPTGAKQVQIHSSHNNIVQLGAFSKPSEDDVHRRGKEYDKRHKASTEVPQKPTTNSLNSHLGSPRSQYNHQNSSPVKTLGTLQQTKETRKPHSVNHKSKLNEEPLSIPAIEQKKKHRKRRTIVIPDDINDLFTPDVIIRPVHKMTKTNLTPPTTEKIHSSSGQSSGSSSLKGDDLRLTYSANIRMSSANHSHISLPSVSLLKMEVKNVVSICSKDSISNSPVPTNESLKSDQENKSAPNGKIYLRDSKQPSTSDCSQSPPIKKHPIGEHREKADKSMDPMDNDLNWDLGITLNFEASQTSKSSEHDQLISLHKAPKTKTDSMSATTEKRQSSIVQRSGSSSLKGEHSGLTCSENIRIPSANHPDISLPSVSLFRMKVEKLVSICSEQSKSCDVPVMCLKSDEENKSVPNSKTHLGVSKQASTSSCSLSPPIKRELIGGHRQQIDEDMDPLEEDLDSDLGITLDLESSQTSDSSEDDHLISLQEIMNYIPKLPDTPEKPGTHGCSSNQLKAPITTKRSSYKNSLYQMIKEIHTHKKAKENEEHLRTAFDEEMLRKGEYEDVGDCEEGNGNEQQEFLQRYTLVSSTIKEVPPGEVVFDLEKFGQIFTQYSLQLRKCMVKPQSVAQKTLLWSSPAQLRLHVTIGLFQEAYGYNAPCPSQVTDFLFKMMSVHSERMVSDKMLQALCDIASSAAYNIVKNGSQRFNVWVPSLANVTLVLINMGVAFVTLFPLENLQPAFTEGDLLEDVYIESDCPSSSNECSTFPEHNCNNIFKYLSYCMSVCPQAYSDYELLLLMTIVARVCLDTRFISLPCVESYTLLYKTVNIIRDWNGMLPRICQAFTDLTDDHHNMCLLIQLLPDNTHGKCLRQHLSLSMISKLLDGTCQYRPKGAEEIQLADLRPYVHRMQPSSLLQGILNTSGRSPKEDDLATLDQQSYYLCHSLLTLTNEVSNFHIFPAHQKEQLLILCSELDIHVKFNIRESVKCLYRCKVKDLLARIYTKWQMLLHQSKPLHCQLYDYWKPSSVKTLACSKTETDNDDRQQASMEEGGEDGSDDFASADDEAEDAKQ